MSESVPSSTTGFAHRRGRADSTTSFTYFEEHEESSGSSQWLEDEAVVDHSDEEEDYAERVHGDLESGTNSPIRRRSSGFSRYSAKDPLLKRNDSSATNASGFIRGGRSTQKIYIINEDLTIVLAGFVTSYVGFFVYVLLCFVSLGLGYLLFRWLPRWKVRLIGSSRPLKECSWIVIEVCSSIKPISVAKCY